MKKLAALVFVTVVVAVFLFSAAAYTSTACATHITAYGPGKGCR